MFRYGTTVLGQANIATGQPVCRQSVARTRVFPTCPESSANQQAQWTSESAQYQELRTLLFQPKFTSIHIDLWAEHPWTKNHGRFHFYFDCLNGTVSRD
jgi:hypothetical protein